MLTEYASPRFRLTAAAVLVAGLVAVPVAVRVAADAATAGPAFTPPLVLAGGGAEPSIRNAPAGQRDPAAAYISAPAGLGSNFWRVDEITNPDGTHSMKGSPPAQPDLGTGGGDSEISVGQLDPATGCSTIAYSGLHNVDIFDNFTVARSTDCGRSFDLLNPYATQNTLTDRQWQTFDGVKTNHLIYHKVDTGQIVDSLSTDGGQTYVTLAGPAGATGIIDAAHAFTLPQVKIGNIVTDYSRPVSGKTYPISGEQVHTLYATFAGTRDAADTVAAQNDPGYDHLNTIYLAKSTDGGLTWTDSTVFATLPTERRELDLVFPVLGVDNAGGLYSAWSDGFKIQYASSKDGGASWSKPFQINTDNRGVTPDTGRADIFPWIAGGGTGKLDVVWYHGEGGNTSSYRNPGTDDAINGTTTWTVAFAQLFNATTVSRTGTPAPTVKAYTNAATPAIHKGSICNNGTTCDVDAPGLKGDRTLLDFFQVSIDSAGRANIAYANDFATPGSASTTYTRQNGGLSALSGGKLSSTTFVPLPTPQGTSCPGPQVVDFSGDAHGSAQVGANASNVETFDILNMGFATPDAAHLAVTMTLKNLSELPAAGTVSSLWYGYFAIGATTYYVSATSNGPGLQSYSVGTYSGGTGTATGAPVGTFTPGPNGTIRWVIDRANIGAPANGAVISGPYADDHGAFQVNGTGVRYTAPVDKAPDVGAGAPYTIGGAC